MDNEDKPVTKKDLMSAVTQIIEFVGDQRVELDKSIEDIKQELYETKVELRNEIRSQIKNHDKRITELENKVFSS